LFVFFRFLFFVLILINIIGLFNCNIFLFFLEKKKRNRGIFLLICLPVYIVLFTVMVILEHSELDYSTFISIIVMFILINILIAFIGGLIVPKKFWPGQKANRLKVFVLYFISLCIVLSFFYKLGKSTDVFSNNPTYTETSSSASNYDDTDYSVNTTPDSTTTPTNKSEKTSQQSSSPDKKITIAGGLGDTVGIWKKQYGDYKGDTSLASFENNDFLVIFVNNKADNITLQFEQTDNKYRTKDEAMAAYQNMIPTDAKKIKEESQGDNDIIYYHSDLLAGTLDKEEFLDASPGTMMAILEKNSNGKYFGVVLAPGNNP
jgi:hypothetical protein